MAQDAQASFLSAMNTVTNVAAVKQADADVANGADAGTAAADGRRKRNTMMQTALRKAEDQAADADSDDKSADR